MGLRLTPADAANRGIISHAEAADMERQARSGRNQVPVVRGMPKPVAVPVPVPVPKAEPAPAAKQLNAQKKADNEIPQRRLFDALRVHLPDAQWEREGLIENRKYRADIFVPPNIVLEMDGFGFHRSKQAFQNDRLRSNIFTQHGFRVFRAFTKQCLDDAMLAELVALIVDAHARPVPASVQ
jgi:very-short-patch-repair endonuclease